MSTLVLSPSPSLSPSLVVSVSVSLVVSRTLVVSMSQTPVELSAVSVPLSLVVC